MASLLILLLIVAAAAQAQLGPDACVPDGSIKRLGFLATNETAYRLNKIHVPQLQCRGPRCGEAENLTSVYCDRRGMTTWDCSNRTGISIKLALVNITRDCESCIVNFDDGGQLHGVFLGSCSLIFSIADDPIWFVLPGLWIALQALIMLGLVWLVWRVLVRSAPRPKDKDA